MKKYIASRLVKLPLRESARICRQSGRGGREQHLHEDPFERPLLLSHLKLLLITSSGKIRPRDILDLAIKSRIRDFKNYLHSEIMAVKLRSRYHGRHHAMTSWL